MLNREEIKAWILKNCIDDNGAINLSGLDFLDVKVYSIKGVAGSVIISNQLKIN